MLISLLFCLFSPKTYSVFPLVFQMETVCYDSTVDFDLLMACCREVFSLLRGLPLT